MTTNSKKTQVTRVEAQNSPEALRHLGRAVIALARWQLDAEQSQDAPRTTPPPAKRTRKPSSSKVRNKPGTEEAAP